MGLGQERVNHSFLKFHKLLFLCRNLRRCPRRMFEVWYSCKLGNTQTSGRFRTTWLRQGKWVELKLILILYGAYARDVNAAMLVYRQQKSSH